MFKNIRALQHVLLHVLPLALFIAACSANHNSNTSTDWSITVGSAGGITGGSTGYTIDPTGQASQWTIATASASKQSKAIKNVDPADAQFFRRYLERIRFDTISSGMPANMMHFVELTENGSTRHVQWGVGSTTSGAGLAALQKFYDSVLSFLSSTQ